MYLKLESSPPHNFSESNSLITNLNWRSQRNLRLDFQMRFYWLYAFVLQNLLSLANLLSSNCFVNFFIDISVRSWAIQFSVWIIFIVAPLNYILLFIFHDYFRCNRIFVFYSNLWSTTSWVYLHMAEWLVDWTIDA